MYVKETQSMLLHNKEQNSSRKVTLRDIFKRKGFSGLEFLLKNHQFSWIYCKPFNQKKAVEVRLNFYIKIC